MGSKNLSVIVELLIDLMWRESHMAADWDKLSPDHRAQCARELALDVEGKFLRLGDPYRGCTPLEYLSSKESEQERMKQDADGIERRTDL